jgi:hypothetical protein
MNTRNFKKLLKIHKKQAEKETKISKSKKRKNTKFVKASRNQIQHEKNNHSSLSPK